MNIQMQCCGLFLLLVLLIFYLRQKRLNLVTEKAFFVVFVVMLCCISLDILSVLCIVQMEYLPVHLVNFVCKSYPVSLVSVAASCLSYVCVDVFVGSARYKRYLQTISVLLFVAGTIIYLLPIHYYYDAETKVLYSYGPSVVATYISASLILLAILLIIFKQKNRINSRRREAVQIWMVMWIGAIILQGLHNELLLVGFTGCIGVMVLYIKLENPETNLERKTGLFNQNALTLYTQQLYSQKVDFSVIFIIFEKEVGRADKFKKETEESLNWADYLSSIPKTKVFKKSQEQLVLITQDKQLAEEWTYKTKDYFEEAFMYPTFFLIPDAQKLERQPDLVYLIRYVRETYKEMAEERINVIGEDIINEMYRERTVTHQILQAIEADRVEVFYQPIYSTKEQRFTSAEALVRIRDEEGKIIPPGMFIDVAEKNGMIRMIGEIVFDKVCRYIKEHRLEQYGVEYIEVNLSVVQCADENLADTYIGIMQKHNVNPAMINLEITESASLSAKKVLLDNMMCLINYGVRFALDDFGTGQSNLNYIVDMPVEIVKFDRYMTNAYFENKKAKYVMNAAMHMIHGMALQIVSEGIETEKQFEAMKQLGINYIQGYYFSKPLPENEFLDFLVANM